MTRRLLSLTVALLDFLPHRALLGLGSFLGTVFWVFNKRKVDRAEARCVSALGLGITPARKIIRRSYANMGRFAAEFIHLDKLHPHLSSLVAIEGKHHLDEALRRGKGALIMTAHIGNWELAGARMVAEGYAITPLYTPQRNTAGVDDLIVSRRTEAAGMHIIPSEGLALREVFRELKKGNILTFLQDLDARKEGVLVPFLGLPASTATGIVRMHQKFGAPIVPVVAVRGSDGVHHTVFVEEILSDQPDEDGNPFGANMEKSLKMCNNLLGHWVEKYPEQWLWLLDKWESVSRF